MNQDEIRKPVASVPVEPQNTEEDIRQLAYQLYERRGREDGHDVEDWLRAEDEITNKKTRTTAA